VSPLKHIILNQGQFVTLTPYYRVVSGEATHNSFVVFGLTCLVIQLSTRLEERTITVRPPRKFIGLITAEPYQLAIFFS
jgi:hypothetical protein